MPKITSKGQVTIPRDIRDKFGFLPGTEVDIVSKDDKALIVKSARENMFLKWLGRGKLRNKKDIDLLVHKLRGRNSDIIQAISLS